MYIHYFRLTPCTTVPPCLNSKADSISSAVGDIAVQAIRGVQLDIRWDSTNIEHKHITIFTEQIQSEASQFTVHLSSQLRINQ